MKKVLLVSFFIVGTWFSLMAQETKLLEGPITLYGRPVVYFPSRQIQCGQEDGKCATIEAKQLYAFQSIYEKEFLDNGGDHSKDLLLLKVFLDEENPLEIFIDKNYSVKQINGKQILSFKAEK